MFGDTSGAGTTAAVYLVVNHAPGVNQGLLAAKSSQTIEDLIIPKLELISAHIAADLAKNIKNAPEGLACVPGV